VPSLQSGCFAIPTYHVRTSRSPLYCLLPTDLIVYQKDYILRMIEMLGDLIAAVFGLVRKGDYTQASDKLDRIYYDMLKEDAAYFRKIPGEDLTHKLLEEHNYTNGHLEILAELFNADAELELAKGNSEECLDFSEKSLLLFEFIDIQQKTLSLERLDKMNSIRDRIDKLRIKDN
jgi:hypothetical protein